jgi:hypothetical protein
MNKIANYLLIIAGLIVSQCIWVIIYIPDNRSKLLGIIVDILFIIVPVLCWLVSFILRIYNTKKNTYNVMKVIIQYSIYLIVGIAYMPLSFWTLALIGIQINIFKN